MAVVPTGGLIGGQIAVMNLDGWTWEEAALKPVVGVSFQFPTHRRRWRRRWWRWRRRPEPRRYEDLKRERDARVKKVEDLIAQARAYGEDARRGAPHRLESRGDGARSSKAAQPLFVQANNEREIRDAVAFADRTGVKIVITGGLESPLVAPLLKEKNIPVILGSVLTTADARDFHHAATYRAAGELAEAGVKFAFGTGGYSDVRALPVPGGHLGGVGPAIATGRCAR